MHRPWLGYTGLGPPTGRAQRAYPSARRVRGGVGAKLGAIVLCRMRRRRTPRRIIHQRLVVPAHLGVSEALRRPLALSTLVATTAGIRRSGRHRRTPSHDPAPRMVRTLRSGAAWNSGAQQGHRRELADPRVRHALGTALQGAVDSGLSDAAIASHTRLGAVLRRSMGRRDEQREAGLAHADTGLKRDGSGREPSHAEAG